MRRSARLLASLFATVLLGAATPSPATVDYIVTPLVGAAGLEGLEVRISLIGDADGSTAIALPDRWAGSAGLHAAVLGLTVTGGTLAAGSEPARRVVTHAPGAPLAIHYRLGPPTPAEPGLDFEKARPVLRPDWFYLHGEGGFVVPEGRGAEPARFRWGALPSGWRTAATLDAADPRRTVDQVVNSILIGGTDLRLFERRVGGQPVRLALRGRWPFEDAALADAVARIVGAENSYLGSGAIPYLVTLAPLRGGEIGAISTGGTGRAGGFALASTTNVGLDQLLFTLAHEYGHRWFGRAFGPTALPEGVEYWFTEGFGDFAAGRVLVRAGLWSVEDYARHLNRALLRYRSSSAVAMPNPVLAELFWTDPDAMQMHYDRGHLFALSLDRDGAVSPALRRLGRGAGFPAAETQSARFIRVFGPPPGLAAMLEGTPIVLPDDLLAACGRFEWAEQPVYATGYAVEDRADGRYFTRVDEGSPAWAAGLRPGMRFVRRVSFEPGDSTVPIVMRVADSAGEREFRWLPEGNRRIRFQRLRLRDLSDGRARRECRARIAGRAL
jgi:predicted metalloprotease with PDZ domain